MIRPSASLVHFRSVGEVFRERGPGFWIQPEWEARFPWLVQGTTGRTVRNQGGFRTSPSPVRGENREGGDPRQALGLALGFPSVPRSLQVHGKRVLSHPVPSGPSSTPDTEADGHLTRIPGFLLSVTVADCVPVFLVDSRSRAVGVLHAGWRGVAAGILESGIDLLERQFGSPSHRLSMHLGPSICGSCYEVGPEVHGALGLPEPAEPREVDLRSALARRAVSRGVPQREVTISSWCTLCGDSPFYSHRAGHEERQLGFIGIRRDGTVGKEEDPA